MAGLGLGIALPLHHLLKKSEAKAAALAACTPSVIDKPYDVKTRKEVDILFVIDNSPSRSPKCPSREPAIKL